MGERKNIDEILRERLSDLSVPYQEGDWEKAQLLLPNQKAAANVRFARTAVGVVVLLGMFGAGFWFGTQQTPGIQSRPTVVSIARQPSFASTSIVPVSAVGAPNIKAHTVQASVNQPAIYSGKETISVASALPYQEDDSKTDYARPFHQTIAMGAQDLQMLKSEFPSPAQFLSLPIDQLAWLAFNPLHKTENETPTSEHFLTGNQLGVLAGAGLFEGFQSKGGFNAVVNPSIGLIFMQWKSRFGFSLGAIYTPRSGVNTEYAYTQTTYNFEAKTDTGFIYTKQLHLLDVPLLMHYQINPKHFVSFGPSVSWLVNTTSTTQLVGEQAKTGILGYHGGFRQFDWGLEAGWGMQVNRALGLNVTAHVGMRDLTRNEIYHDSRFNRNLGLRVMLRYKLFANR